MGEEELFPGSVAGGKETESIIPIPSHTEHLEAWKSQIPETDSIEESHIEISLEMKVKLRQGCAGSRQEITKAFF
jgi:hypothetical protein